MDIHKNRIVGLTDDEVIRSRTLYGKNELIGKKPNWFKIAVGHLAGEPIVVLLFLSAIIYFLTGNFADGFFLTAAILLISLISFVQDRRSKRAIRNLQQFSQPLARVFRSGEIVHLPPAEIVIGDCVVAEENSHLVADGLIISSNDFSVNESILTGESMPVSKDKSSKDNVVFAGTTVVSGLATYKVTAIGNGTRLGKIGKSLESIKATASPLQLQIRNFVKRMVLVGIAVFLALFLYSGFTSGSWLLALINGLTLAISILPEEIPVAFTAFMAIGSWRLLKLGIVVKQLNTVETLGSATVICVDKTGTITQNKMSVAKLYSIHSDRTIDPASEFTDAEKELLKIARLASEPIPFDPMEVSINELYKKELSVDDFHFKMIHEYPLEGKPPMMTHIFEDPYGHRTISAKGAPQAIIQVSALTAETETKVNALVSELASSGYRVLAIAKSGYQGNSFPDRQQQLQFSFIGLVAFSDPPKSNIREVLQGFYQAGIEVKIITGDNPVTTNAIAEQIGFRGCNSTMSGEQLVGLGEAELHKVVNEINVFTRMFPEAKLKIINALKANGHVVAMTGDGVNDGPALKAAHIGIAMGKKGTAIAKDSASLILSDDDLSRMLDAIAMGRRIYANLKKAIRYIISIHIPIILTVSIPIFMGWKFPNIFSPVHVILLELIMGPTCSIIYENEPAEKSSMHEKPRPFAKSFFNWNELGTSIIQGLAITVGVLAVYQAAVRSEHDETTTRTMVFTTLMIANILLTLVNRSFYESIFRTARYKNDLIAIITVISITLTALMIYFEPLAAFLDFTSIDLATITFCTAVAAISVLWFEGIKFWKRRTMPQGEPGT